MQSFIVFIPPSCEDIHFHAFAGNKDLSLFHVPEITNLQYLVLYGARLIEFCEFEDRIFSSEEENTFVKEQINAGDKYRLHGACASFQPLKDDIYDIIEEEGLRAFSGKNEIGITPSRYLNENPYADATELEIIRECISKKLNF
ncbi:predicted protein [Chaetoceros tenuissimus]|uniref:Uncharacterized protein n=1 Tax=Chaetoceros tenuissimus TaxID=426638 RepID=A0AAD3D279_9STRA|nr:predicted protein [Chaetoceros tenuissimus]